MLTLTEHKCRNWYRTKYGKYWKIILVLRLKPTSLERLEKLKVLHGGCGNGEVINQLSQTNSALEKVMQGKKLSHMETKGEQQILSINNK